MKRFKSFIFTMGVLCFLISAAGCASFSASTDQAATDSDEIYWMSMIEVIANPERYDGKQVTVTGFLGIEFESQSLYLHREDYEYYLVKNSLAVDLSDHPEANKWDRRYVTIDGTFKAVPRTQSFSAAGALIQVKSITPRPANMKRTF